MKIKDWYNFLHARNSISTKPLKVVEKSPEMYGLLVWGQIHLPSFGSEQISFALNLVHSLMPIAETFPAILTDPLHFENIIVWITASLLTWKMYSSGVK